MLEPDRESNQIGRHARRLQLRGLELTVRGGRRMDDQRAGVANIGQVTHELRSLDALDGIAVAATHAEREQTGCPRTSVKGSHQALYQIRLRMIGQPRVVHPRHLRVLLQKLRNGQGIAAVPLHAQRQGLHALQDLPGTGGGEGGAIDPQHLHASAHGETKVAKGLVELHAMVAGGGLGHAGKFAVVPGESAGLHHHAGEGRAVSSEVLGGRVHHDVGAPLQGVAQVRGGDGVVDDEGQSVRMRHLGHRRNVQQDQAGVAQAFREHGPCVGLDGGSKRIRVMGIDKGGLDAKAAQVHRQHGDTAAIEGTGGHHMVALLQQCHQCHGFGGHATGAGNRSTSAFQRGHAFLQGGHGGVGQSRVHIAKGLQVEQAGRVLSTVKHIAGGLVDG